MAWTHTQKSRLSQRRWLYSDLRRVGLRVEINSKEYYKQGEREPSYQNMGRAMSKGGTMTNRSKRFSQVRL